MNLCVNKHLHRAQTWHKEGEKMAEKQIPTFGEFFREARLKRGYSQEEIAEALSNGTGTNITKEDIDSWENGTGSPSGDDYFYINILLDLTFRQTMESLFGGF